VFFAGVWSGAYTSREVVVGLEQEHPWPAFSDTIGIVIGFVGLQDAHAMLQVSKEFRKLMLVLLQYAFASCAVPEWRNAVECGVTLSRAMGVG
jgi:hypothetical protein